MLHVQHDQLQPVSFAIRYLRFHWSAQSIVPLVPLHLRTPSLWFDWSAQSKVQVYLCTCALVQLSTPSLWFDWSAQSNAGRKESNGWDESNAWVEGQSGKTDVMMTGVGWQSGHHKENELRMCPECVPKMSKHNVMNVAIAETERVPFLVLDFSWSLRRVCQQPSVGRCVSRVPIPPFIFLLFVANYLISQVPILKLISTFSRAYPCLHLSPLQS